MPGKWSAEGLSMSAACTTPRAFTSIESKRPRTSSSNVAGTGLGAAPWPSTVMSLLRTEGL